MKTFSGITIRSPLELDAIASTTQRIGAALMSSAGMLPAVSPGANYGGGRMFRRHGGPGSNGGQPTGVYLPNAGGIPNFKQLSAYEIYNSGWVGLRWALYDSAAYPAAGIPSITFFGTGLGQGVGFGGQAKTISDTNLELGGQLPAETAFLVQSIEVDFQPSTPTPAAGADMPSTFGTGAVDHLLNDVYVFRRSGALTFTVSNTKYLIDAPMGKFPVKSRYQINAAVADATTPAAAQQSKMKFGDYVGRPYILTPGDIQLQAGASFNVKLTWDEGNQPIVNPARVFVRLDGTLYRRST